MTSEIAPIEYMKSALSINTFAGCPLACAYCIVRDVVKLDADDAFKPVRLETSKGLIERLVNNPLFIPNKTLLAVNNKTEPFIHEVKKDTLDILDLLSNRKLTNPIMLISKINFSKQDIEFLNNYQGKIYYLCSYSNLPKEIEPLSNQQLRDFKNLYLKRKIIAVHYWRPIIKGLNDSEESIFQVLNAVVPYFDASVVSGLRITPEIAFKIARHGGNFKEWDGNSNHKYLPADFAGKALRVRDANFSNYPLFLKTSCAISALEGIPDYNFNFLKNQYNCQNCSNKPNCRLRDRPAEGEVKKYFDMLSLDVKWAYGEDYININDSITSDQRSFLSFNLNYPIHAKFIRDSTFEESLRTKR